MLKHYFQIATRNLAKQKILTAINVLSLSIGISCFSLILLYAVNEFSFDRFHVNSGSLYRVYRLLQPTAGYEASADVYLPMPLGPAIKQELPGIKDFARMQEAWKPNLVKSGGQIYQVPVSFADPQIFSMFSFPLKYGNAKTALSDLRNVVLTEKTSKQLFGNDNPTGKMIQIKLGEEFEPFYITGVAENIPSNSSITFDILGNYNYIGTTKNGSRSVNNWNRSAYLTYVQTEPGKLIDKEIATLQSFYTKYHPDEEKELREKGYWKGKGLPTTYGLQPLLNMHIDTVIQGGSGGNTDPKNIWILVGIASAVLIIACINFTTLAIGRSAGRSREVGIRKVIGSGKRSLVIQFITEAVFLSIISAVIGLVLANLLLPSFNELSGRELSFSITQYPELFWLLILLTLFVGLISGSYPSLVLARFNPIEVLKQKTKVGGSNFFTRSLVTAQFVLSIGLIASTTIILQQIKFMTGKNPGFTKENIVVVDAADTDSKKFYPLFKQAVTKHPQIQGIASAELSFGEGKGWSRSGFDYNGVNKQVFEYFIDPEFIPLMDMKMVAGRNFRNDIADDTIKSVIVNEAMVKDFGWTIENAVGQELKGYYENDNSKNPVVIGVVRNFNFRPLKEDVKPQMFHQFADYTSYKYLVRIQAGDPSGILSTLENDWKKLQPDFPFQYSFLDEDLDRFYKSEKRWRNIIGWAGGISIFLACLGLYGLIALAAVNRIKEVGIRKVLGASVASIAALLSRDYLKLVAIAISIATPISWYFTHQWLQDYTYRINIGWWVFIMAGLAALVIAIITVSFQTIRTAMENPVKSLRTE
jgi:putative ABC transport system permease protein